MTDMQLSVIFAVRGKYEFAEAYLADMLKVALRGSMRHEFIFAMAGDVWPTLPIVQQMKTARQNIKFMFFSEPGRSLADLFNCASGVATNRHLIFVAENYSFDLDVIKNFERFSADGVHSDFLYCGSRFLQQHFELPTEPDENRLFDWLTYDEVVPLSYFCISRSAFDQIGGFDSSPFLNDNTVWDFLARLSRDRSAIYMGLIDDADKYSNPPANSKVLGGGGRYRDLARRYIHRIRKVEPRHAKQSELRCGDPTFLRDLPREDHEAIIGLEMHGLDQASTTTPCQGISRPIKITITGGFWEYAHNWLCFYNYLDYLSGSGFATYKVILETDFHVYDLADTDILIISRGRTRFVKEMIDACRAREIPTVYMIDDNWFSISRDWPAQYGELFAENGPTHRNFMYGIANCDFVLTYNPLLADDARQFAKKVVILPNSVDLARFESIDRPLKSKFVVGYVGTPRYTEQSFRALSAVGRRDDVEILLMGVIQPETEALLQNCRVNRMPYQNYRNYIGALRGAGADVLIAPLDETRTSRSKCPNKYLEITAAGAVGIYSRIEPYTFHVKDGVSGVFVSPSADEAEWIVAIERLLDRDIISFMHQQARDNVLRSYDVPIVARLFENFISSVVNAVYPLPDH